MFLESPAFWALIGVILLIAEVFTLNLILVFFGVAALFVAALTVEGTVEGLAEQLVCFSGLSVLFLVSLRRFLSRWFKGSARKGSASEDDSGLLNRRAQVTTAFVDGAGKVLVGGTAWDAVSDADLAPGDTVKVTGRSGITLTVAPLDGPRGSRH